MQVPAWLIATALMLTPGPAANAGWAVPPAGYAFEATEPCRADAVRAAKPARPGDAAYDVCGDQMAIFAKALEAARGERKLLLVTFGATWCGWCAALQKDMPTAAFFGRQGDPIDYAKTFHHVEIVLSMVDKGRQIRVPSGEAVLQVLLDRAPGAKMRAIPFLAVVDPASPERVVARNLDDLAIPGRNTFEMSRFRGMTLEAANYVRGLGPTPAEPGWLKRKWLRFWSG